MAQFPPTPSISNVWEHAPVTGRPVLPPEPTQEEMNELASKLTEAVLLLRAGDMEGARKTLGAANELCGVQIRGTFRTVPEHYLDAARYGIGITNQYQPQKPLPRSATEIIIRQQLVEQQMQRAMSDIEEKFIEKIQNVVGEKS